MRANLLLEGVLKLCLCSLLQETQPYFNTLIPIRIYDKKKKIKKNDVIQKKSITNVLFTLIATLQETL